jgi:beta-xylosidase
MKKRFLFFVLFILLFNNAKLSAWIGMPTPRLHVEGRYLKDTHGNIVNLHGFAQTYSPWFNEMGSKWTNYNVSGCLSYNKGIIDKVLAAGWKMNFMRLHMDPYWSNTPGCTPHAHELPNCFNETRFRKYLDEVFVPMAEYAISKGLYVIIRPPGVCPEEIGVEDDYNYAQYLMTVWDIVSKHPKIKNSPQIMFELGNEPVRIILADGSVGSNTQAHFDVLKAIFQPIVNKIRSNGFNNVLWIPGSGYQSQYKGFAVNPIEGPNIGYAVHIYPGWFGSANGYEVFKKEWDEQIKPVTDFAPIVITEMDWADEKYQSSWGKGFTGVAGGDGFGANFKKIVDDAGNVSWLLFTDAHLLAQFKPTPPATGQPYTFLTDPEACPWPIYHWYLDYATKEYPRPDFSQQSKSDNGNGTYTNPLIYADFPDPDVIRVGDTYYMVSTTMQFFPGATLLQSKDLVNWEYLCNPLEMIEPSDAYNLLNGQQRYAKGQWASSLRYNNGRFYILFNTNDEGAFLLVATNPKGNWDLKKLSRGFYDPSLLFDSNGKIYVVHGINDLRVTELDTEFRPIGTDQLVVSRPNQGLEGSHFYKIGNYYYIYSTYGGWPASQTVFRSTDVFGPYEEKLLLDKKDNIHQGALIETQTDEWWTILFYDKGPLGRLPNLQPIVWQNDWPLIGDNGSGEPVTTYRKPNVGSEYLDRVLPTNDNFRSYKLGPQWAWNHLPDNSKWSLFERPGYLRLKTASVSNDLLSARNTLTQRIFGYYNNHLSYATALLDVSQMAEGDIAGLTVFQDPYGYIAVKKQNGAFKLVASNYKIPVVDNKKQYQSEQLNNVEIDLNITGQIFLRAIYNNTTRKAQFYYSVDNQNYMPFGFELNTAFDLSVFVGNRFGLFNYATQQLGGHVDIDWFSTEIDFKENRFYDSNFVGYSLDEITVERIYPEKLNIEVLVGTNKTLKMFAQFKDARIENINTKASFISSNPDVAQIINGLIVSRAIGTSVITAEYEDLLGNITTTSFEITASMFPFAADIFNPSIYANGTYNESTRTLVTGQYGFGGWRYDNGIDLSGYNFLVVDLEAPQQAGASFRLYDQNSYWSTPVMYDMGTRTRLVVNLKRMNKNDANNTTANPKNLYYIGFWSTGGQPICIKDIYVTNSSTYEKPNSVDEVNFDLNPYVNVYTVTGVLIRTNVLRAEATIGLLPGVYLVGNKKVMIMHK